MRNLTTTGLTLGILAASTIAQASAPQRQLAPMTVAQDAILDRMLAAPVAERAIAADKVEALPLIRMLAATGACAVAAEAWNATNDVQMRPHTFSGYLPFLAPMMRMDHHDNARCLNVVRIDSWTKPAKNALRYKVSYVADDSGEAGRLVFELQKASDGRWLVRDFGSALEI